LCHPAFEGYVDTPPKRYELQNCHYWLRRQNEYVKPHLIVTIGNVALQSMKLYFQGSGMLREFILKENIGSFIQDTDPWIYPLYHTSRRGRLSRNAENQKADWLKIISILNI
jgi:uracil-DNA glycosylase